MYLSHRLQSISYAFCNILVKSQLLHLCALLEIADTYIYDTSCVSFYDGLLGVILVLYLYIEIKPEQDYITVNYNI